MEKLPAPLQHRAAQVRAHLAAAQRAHGPLVYSNSLGAEAMVLTDIIWTHLPAIDMFSIDTGRLHERITGVRREQSSVRAALQPLEWDPAYGLYKLSPLLEWSEEHVWQYIRARQLP